MFHWRMPRDYGVESEACYVLGLHLIFYFQLKQCFLSLCGARAGNSACVRSFANDSLTRASGLRRGVGDLLRFGTTLEFLVSTAVRVLGVRFVFRASQIFH